MIEVSEEYIGLLMNLVVGLAVIAEIYIELEDGDKHEIQSMIVLGIILTLALLIGIPAKYYFSLPLYLAYRFGLFDPVTSWKRRRELFHYGDNPTDRLLSKFNQTALLAIRFAILEASIVASILYYEIIRKLNLSL